MDERENLSREDTARDLVRDLFDHLISGAVPEGEITAWAAKLLKCADPVGLLSNILNLAGVKEKYALEKDSRTRWPSGHFYSPVGSRNLIFSDKDRINSQRKLLGINLRQQDQLALLAHLAPYFKSAPFSDEPSRALRYGYKNPSYNYGDAIVYWAMINYLRPRRIIEIGSGYSSALALDAIDLLALPTACTFIDPYPQVAEAITAPLHAPHRIIAKRVQDFELEGLNVLGQNDILFIDSSHVLKTGSDVHFELTEVLPRLGPGVVVHFHDTFANFEYPERWIIDDNHSWNELYALHAFLMFNDRFRIEYFNSHVATNFAAEVRALAPNEASRILLNPGGGLWLRRM